MTDSKHKTVTNVVGILKTKGMIPGKHLSSEIAEVTPYPPQTIGASIAKVEGTSVRNVQIERIDGRPVSWQLTFRY